MNNNRYLIVKTNAKGERYIYRIKHDTKESAVSYLKKIRDFYIKSAEKVEWYDCSIPHGDLVFYNEKTDTLEDWSSGDKWEIVEETHGTKEEKMLVKYIDAFCQFLKDNNLRFDNYDVNEEFMLFLFEFADKNFDKKLLENDSNVIRLLLGVSDLASCWAIGGEKAEGQIWESLYKHVYGVEED